MALTETNAMSLSKWFSKQLQASADGFVWGIEQLPAERLYATPPALLGEWPAARHASHMLYYEQNMVLPCMKHWLGELLPSFDSYDEDAGWEDAPSIESLLAQFQAIRAEQIELTSKFDEAAWNETRDVVWGPVTLRWIVSKTYQHTAEHTNDVLRMALFWDRIARRQAEADAKAQAEA